MKPPLLRFSLFFSLGVLGVLAVQPLSHAARPPGLWERAASPGGGDKVDRLVERAQAELEDRSAGAASKDSMARAEALLRDAIKLDPRHFEASVLLGEALASAGRTADAIAAFARACNLARTRADESFCTARLGLERMRAGRYADALADYDRHIRLGDAQTMVVTNSAEVLMALGRLREAEARYREAVRLATAARPGRERDETLALSYYGLAVALDRDGRDGPSREAVARALAHDPKLDLLEAGREARGGVFFVPPGDIHYYRGLALSAVGRPQEALEAFERYLAEQKGARYAKRAEAHVAELSAAAGAKRSVPRASWRLLAAATIHAEGAISAPLIDSTWKSRARALEPCFEGLPLLERPTVRLAVDVELDGTGAVKKAYPLLPAAWQEATACVEDRLKELLRVPRPSKPRPTTARLELVVAKKN